MLRGRGEFVNHSLSITVGGTPEELMPENRQRLGLFVQNVSSGDIYVAFSDEADDADPSNSPIKILPDAALTLPGDIGFVDLRAVQVYGATTGQKVIAYEALR